MKRRYFVCLIFLILPIVGKSTDAWEKIDLPFIHESYCAYFIDKNIGWVTSSWGEVAKTTDGGDTWQKQFTMYAEQPIWDIQFVDHLNGWIASWDGIFYTEDGGSSWIKQNSPTLVEYICFINKNEGWGCSASSNILKTIDGGNNWYEIVSLQKKQLIDIQFIDSQIGWVLSWDGSIYKSQNGGKDWIEQISNSGPDSLRKLFFLDQDFGWAVGYHGLFYTTSDGGDNWSKKYIEDDVRLNGICFINRMSGWIVGSSGSIYHTQDGGLNWEKQLSNVTRSLWFVQFVDSNNGWICGYIMNMLRTKTGGTSSIETSYVDNNDLSISPNPIHSKSNIRFSTLYPGTIIFNLRDILGTTISSFDIGFCESGTHESLLDLENIKTGVYFITMSHYSVGKITNKTIKLVISK